MQKLQSILELLSSTYLKNCTLYMIVAGRTLCIKMKHLSIVNNIRNSM